MKAAPAMEAAAVAAAMETAAITAIAAVVIARTPIDSATPAIPAAVIAAPVIAAAIIGRAVIPTGVERRDVTGGRIDAGLIATGKRDRERRNDCAQKNPTANHGFSSFAYLIVPELLSPLPGRPINRWAAERSSTLAERQRAGALLVALA
jgi:hypothetical protein